MVLREVSLIASVPTYSPSLNNEPVFRELVHEFFATYELGAYTCRNNPKAARGEIGMANALGDALMVSIVTVLLLFWPTIRDGERSIWWHVCDPACLIFWDFDSLDDWSVEPPAKAFKKKSLVAMDIIIELVPGHCISGHEPREVVGSSWGVDGLAGWTLGTARYMDDQT
ncbi:hypothetical protein Tco_1173927 [Tanacetum coccineum]